MSRWRRGAGVGGQVVNVSYQGQEQVKRLSAAERAELTRVLGEGGARATDAPDQYVSDFGDGLRVLWRKAGGDVVVLNVVSQPPAL